MNETLTDYVTGREIPNAGPEGNRQLFEKVLVEQKGYAKQDIKVDQEITVFFKGEPYTAALDIVVFVKDTAFMAARCIAGSLGSYEREILAGARLVFDYQIPFSVSTDGKDALIRNTRTGELYGEGMDKVPSKEEAAGMLATLSLEPFPENKKEREMIIYRSYNIEKVHREC